MATPDLQEQAEETHGGGQLAQIRDFIRQATEARKEYERAAGIYAGLAFVEARLEAERSLVKLEAIKRLMAQENPIGKPDANGVRPRHSGSSAEALVEMDESYTAHLRLQRETVRDKNHAHCQMQAARMRVDISLAAVKAIGGFQ